MYVLRTERLDLRWFLEGDAAFVLELLNDPSWIANIGDRGVRTLEDARAFIRDRLTASYWQKGHGLWAIERREDQALVGMCGLLERDSLPAIDVGYALLPRSRGQGYAREAAKASLRYAREVLGERRVLAIVRPGNGPSFRVLESLGMERVGSHRMAPDDRELALFSTAPSEAEERGDARAEIDALVRRFFSAFSNRHALSKVASVPSMFLPDAVVSILKPSDVVERLGVPDFVSPRAALLHGGRLTDFAEEEVEARTEVVGALAQRSSRYRKAGQLDGARFEGAGNKLFQLVMTRRGWRIAALAWEDNRA